VIAIVHIKDPAADWFEFRAATWSDLDKVIRILQRGVALSETAKRFAHDTYIVRLNMLLPDRPESFFVEYVEAFRDE
jgi:hypothetical protein